MARTKAHRKTFRFLDLPPEIRIRIYEIHLRVERTIDMGAYNHTKVSPLLEVLRTNKQLYEEAYRVFYGINTFRVFSTDGKYIHTRRPLFSRMPEHYLAAMTTLELRLGPGWTKPPAVWGVSPVYNLQHCTSMRMIKVFIELDPEDSPICREWMATRTSYTEFGMKHLTGLLKALPSVQEVRFDGFPSVRKDGPLMRALHLVCMNGNVKISYGHIRGWQHEKSVDDIGACAKQLGFVTTSLLQLIISA